MPDVMEIPTLDIKYEKMLVACGHLVTEDLHLIERIRQLYEKKRLVAYRGSGESAEAVIFFAGGPPGTKHLHLDIARRKFFESLPAENSTVAEISGHLAEFAGHQVDVRVFGRFIVPMASLPERGFIKTAMFRANVGSLNITQVASTLALSGADPVKRVEWSLDEGEGTMQIEVELFAQLKLDNLYPARLHSGVMEAFQGLILREISGGTT